MIEEKDLKNAVPASQFDWKTKTILVVEDQEINFYYISETLADTGVNFIYADNGLSALKLFQENTNIDLVLMDVKMPILSGYEATKQMKKIRPEVPVIAQTAYSLSGEKRKSMEAGCDDYLSKPISPDELVETVAKYLDK
jgi:two-component system, cell cycle response regulator DivK